MYLFPTHSPLPQIHPPMRTLTPTHIHSQALRLSSKARRNSTVGEIVNLMSVDAQRFVDLMTFIHLIWSAPLQILLSLIFLYNVMGPSIFAGLAMMLLLVPFNAAIASYSKRLQAKQMVFKDSRIKLINEVLNGIKVRSQYMELVISYWVTHHGRWKVFIHVWDQGRFLPTSVIYHLIRVNTVLFAYVCYSYYTNSAVLWVSWNWYYVQV